MKKNSITSRQTSTSVIIRSITFILIGMLFFHTTVSATDKENTNPNLPRSYQNIDVSYIIGAQIFNDNFIYNPGFSANLSYGLLINDYVGLGIGTGYRKFEKESFLPIYGEITGYKKNKSNTPVIKMQLGYSYGWDAPSNLVEGYEFSGGVFLGAGMGRIFKIKNEWSVMLHWSYQHQFAKMKYTIFNTQGYSEVLNYDMFVLSIGFIRENR